MSDAVTPMGHARFDGFATVREIGPLGMISLRCDHAAPALAGALAALGLAMPGQRRILQAEGGRAAGWMSPDEVLLVMPRDAVGAALTTLAEKLAGTHHLAVDVSDARAVFRIEGDRAAEVLAKLCPVDLAALAPDELRRTRAAQVAAAIWPGEGGYTLVSFRSVAAYVMGILTHAAQPGSELNAG